jgi:lipopolysaccharide transport system permease protein
MNFLVFLALHVALDHTASWTSIFLPVVMFPLVLLTLGVSWFLAALGVYLRDIGQITGVLATALLFLSPAMYPIDILPPQYRWLIMMNPLTFIMDQAREVALWGHFPNWTGLGIYTACALLVMYLGYGAFRLTQRGFADVI